MLLSSLPNLINFKSAFIYFLHFLKISKTTKTKNISKFVECPLDYNDKNKSLLYAKTLFACLVTIFPKVEMLV